MDRGARSQMEGELAMTRNFAGVSDWRHRALVQAAIEDRAALPGVSREQAVREVLDQEYEWRRQEMEAARYSVAQEYAEILQAVGSLFVRACRKLARTHAR
jgi:hypothetical protein